MKDKEMIEEMAKDMYNDVSNIFEEEYEKRKLITPSFCANKLLEKGYRKLPKDSVVLSKEEYEVLKIKEREKHWLETCMVVWKNGKIDGSKETAEKILKEILFVKGIKDWQENKQLVEFSNRIVDKIEELAKQFGVE